MLELEFSNHAKDVMVERSIDLHWIQDVVARPELELNDKHDLHLKHYLGKIEERGNRVLRVVVNVTVEPQKVVTVYFDRSMKDRL